MAFSIQNLGLTVPTQQKPQGFFNSVGTSMGLGPRHEPLDVMPFKNPGVGNYDLAKDASENSNPTWKFGTSVARKVTKREPWPAPGDTFEKYVPGYIEIKSHNVRANDKERTILTTQDPYYQDKARLNELREKSYSHKMQYKGDSLGPGQYWQTNKQKKEYIPMMKTQSGPIYSFGSRFDSSVQNKDHLKTRKVDGPGPGAYKLPGSVQVKSRAPGSVCRPTFGTSQRNYIDIPQENPGPDRYRKEKFTEASHSYSFSQDFPKIKETRLIKEAPLPGPHTYNNQTKDLKNQMHLAKSMLGGSTEEKPFPDNGNPGPAAYKQIEQNSIPCFKIVQHTKNVKRSNEDIAKMEKTKDVGPLSYSPRNPSLYRSDHLKKNSIGNATRQDMVARNKVPGPGNYVITGDFEKGKENPKFHMGIKTSGFMGKNLDMPGAGEYETDVIPIHHSNVAHFIGTSVRSDLGVGKAYMYPGPGEYEAQIDSTMDPRIRIAGTFGTQKKDTVVKKTFAPGPGSYDQAGSVGLMPQYLRTEENRAAKAAQEAALRARLEI